MKVKDLLAKLVEVDQELDVAFRYENHEYWGHLYTIAEQAGVRNELVDGPKKYGRMVFVIED